MSNPRRWIVRCWAAGSAALALLLATTASSPAAAADAPQFEWNGVERVVAFADVHGAYDELVALLQSQGIVGADLHWAGGRTHLVSLGDLLDRGDDSRKVMDLLMRLQQESAAAGGQVHVVVGNHEAMNVLGDLRYVSRGEYASYQADEDAAERDTRRAEWLARDPGRTAADFDRQFPPGYFGHRRLLGPDGRYGRWILAQPVMIRVNDAVYLHGGPSRLLVGRDVASIDRDYAAAFANYVAAESAARGAGLVQFEDPYARRPDLARARLAAMPEGPARAAAAPLVDRLAAADDDPMLNATGPNWYRGTALCNECAEADVLQPFLAGAGAKRAVLGHTVARNGTAVSRFDGTVVKLDAGMNARVYHGRPAALVSDAAGVRVAYANPTVPAAPVPAEPIHVSSDDYDEDTVAAILAGGTVETLQACGPGVLRVRVTQDGRSVQGLFEAVPDDVVGRELAAWQLDRRLRLGLVPATVARDVGGAHGVLQARPADWASERDRQAVGAGQRAPWACQAFGVAPRAEPQRRPAGAEAVPERLPTGGYCDVAAQFQLAYVFDALIGNQGRTLDRYLYDIDPQMQWRGLSLLLTGHGSAFGTGTTLPPALAAEVAKSGPEIRARLAALDRASVESAIGAWIGPREVSALLDRRDRILAAAKAGPGR
ncbi:MAG: metallophosphoesterase [Steroidobacteraceae bacterium]